LVFTLPFFQRATLKTHRLTIKIKAKKPKNVRNCESSASGTQSPVHRQMMGDSSETMTQLFSGEIPMQDVASAFSKTFGNQIDVLETMETEAAA